MDKDGHILPVEEIRREEGNVTGNVTENVTDTSTAEKRRNAIIRLINNSPKITTDNLANVLHVSRRTIQRDIDVLRASNKVKREGDDFGGKWIVIE